MYRRSSVRPDRFPPIFESGLMVRIFCFSLGRDRSCPVATIHRRSLSTHSFCSSTHHDILEATVCEDENENAPNPAHTSSWHLHAHTHNLTRSVPSIFQAEQEPRYRASSRRTCGTSATAMPVEVLEDVVSAVDRTTHAPDDDAILHVKLAAGALAVPEVPISSLGMHCTAAALSSSMLATGNRNWIEKNDTAAVHNLTWGTMLMGTVGTVGPSHASSRVAEDTRRAAATQHPRHVKGPICCADDGYHNQSWGPRR